MRLLIGNYRREAKNWDALSFSDSLSACLTNVFHSLFLSITPPLSLSLSLSLFLSFHSMLYQSFSSKWSIIGEIFLNIFLYNNTPTCILYTHISGDLYIIKTSTSIFHQFVWTSTVLIQYITSLSQIWAILSFFRSKARLLLITLSMRLSVTFAFLFSGVKLSSSNFVFIKSDKKWINNKIWWW